MASSPTGTGSCSNWRLTIAAGAGDRADVPATRGPGQVPPVGAEPSPLRETASPPTCACAGRSRTTHGAGRQPGFAAHGAGSSSAARADSPLHQDPPAARSSRLRPLIEAIHRGGLGTPVDPASSGWTAAPTWLRPVQHAPWPGCEPDSTPGLTAHRPATEAHPPVPNRRSSPATAISCFSTGPRRRNPGTAYSLDHRRASPSSRRRPSEASSTCGGLNHRPLGTLPYPKWNARLFPSR